MGCVWSVAPGDPTLELQPESPKVPTRVPRATRGTTSAPPFLTYSPGSGGCCPSLPPRQVGLITSSHRELERPSGNKSGTLISGGETESGEEFDQSLTESLTSSVGCLINGQCSLTKTHFPIWPIKWHMTCHHSSCGTWNWGVEGSLTKKTFAGTESLLGCSHPLSRSPAWILSGLPPPSPMGLDLGYLTLGPPLP